MPFEINKIECLDLFMAATAIQELTALSKRLKKKIYIKRDDRTGFVYSGNKIRKLSYLLKDAQKQNCNLVITCGGIQSNHARATAFAAKELAMNSCLLLRGEELNLYKGNYLLNKLIGADIRYISVDDWPNNYSRMELISKEFQQQGMRPYIIPEGGSNEIGALGYFKCLKEIVDQSKISFSDIFTATGSGGTTAGLLLGKAILSKAKNIKIHTVNVCDDEEYFQSKILNICDDFKKRYSLPNLKIQTPSIFDNYVGPGYAESTTTGLNNISSFCAESGILLDPVYTGKAFFGMIEEIQKKPENFGDEILFIHTGGGFANFSFEEAFSAII